MNTDTMRLLRRSDEPDGHAVPPQPRGDLSESGPISSTCGDARVMHDMGWWEPMHDDGAQIAWALWAEGRA